jgi:hypothetical protein
MNLFQNIYNFLRSIFEVLSFTHKSHGFEPFYDDDSGHTVYEYNFVPINEKFTSSNGEFTPPIENTMIRL